MRDRIDRTDVVPLVLIAVYVYMFRHWFAVGLGLLVLAAVVVLVQRRSQPLVVTVLQFACVAFLLVGGAPAVLPDTAAAGPGSVPAAGAALRA